MSSRLSRWAVGGWWLDGRQLRSGLGLLPAGSLGFPLQMAEGQEAA